MFIISYFLFSFYLPAHFRFTFRPTEEDLILRYLLTPFVFSPKGGKILLSLV